MRETSSELHESQATLLYDAECRFCRWAMGVLLLWDRRRRLFPLALQEPAADRLLADLAPEQRMETWHLIASGGVRHSGGMAFVPLFELLPAGQPLARLAGRFPAVATRLYDAVAGHRNQLAKLIPKRLQRLAARRLQERAKPPRG
jgi:predicted DCC family thiol-disulfide oxidoreductase YuxK